MVTHTHAPLGFNKAATQAYLRGVGVHACVLACADGAKNRLLLTSNLIISRHALARLELPPLACRIPGTAYDTTCHGMLRFYGEVLLFSHTRTISDYRHRVYERLIVQIDYISSCMREMGLYAWMCTGRLPSLSSTGCRMNALNRPKTDQ